MPLDGDRMAGGTTGDPTQGGPSRAESVSRAESGTAGDLPGDTGRMAAEAQPTATAPAPGGGYGSGGSPSQSPERVAREAAPVQQSAISAPNALLLIAGVWLIISRLVFDYPAAGSTAGGVINGVVIGIAVAIMALVRMSAYRSNPMINVVTVVAGAWMMASPWAFGYPHFGTGGRPAWSDIIVGAAIILLGLVGAAGQAMRRTETGRRAGMFGRGHRPLATR